jgi:hypothetical protein
MLEKLLPLLKGGGHRVLIFSQFLGVLNVIEDFMTGMSRHMPSFGKQPFCRIDGSTSTATRQRLIAEFNAPDSPYFVMLISTHAGGQGLLRRVLCCLLRCWGLFWSHFLACWGLCFVTFPCVLGVIWSHSRLTRCCHAPCWCDCLLALEWVSDFCCRIVVFTAWRVSDAGINLASADTVILFDPDWNPHMDLQAAARVHRPGQKKRVVILRLVRGLGATVEGC